jgi:hypothetical protein
MKKCKSPLEVVCGLAGCSRCAEPIEGWKAGVVRESNEFGGQVRRASTYEVLLASRGKAVFGPAGRPLSHGVWHTVPVGTVPIVQATLMFEASGRGMRRFIHRDCDL